MTIRVAIIDDSPTMRAILQSRLAGEADLVVVGMAANASEGRALIKMCNPDVVTLDIEMPEMNGLEFLEKIMTLRPMPVIIVSGLSQKGGEVAARAMALGAVDCYAKCDKSGGLPLHDRGELASRIRQAAKIKFDGRRPKKAPAPAPITPFNRSEPAVIAIGSSTGGVEALQTLLSAFPASCPPTVVVQHVNPRFAPAIAQSLDSACPAKVQLAEADLRLHPGNIYLAPGGERHLMIGGSGPYFAKLRTGELVSGHRPSVDVLFESVARVIGASAVGILLTGMGSDGARGLLSMVRAGARTIAQDEATSTVFGMPKAAIALNAAETVAPIHQIARHALTRAAA